MIRGLAHSFVRLRDQDNLPLDAFLSNVHGHAQKGTRSHLWSAVRVEQRLPHGGQECGDAFFEPFRSWVSIVIGDIECYASCLSRKRHGDGVALCIFGQDRRDPIENIDDIVVRRLVIDVRL